MQYARSPEDTDVYKCLSCGNDHAFVGIDASALPYSDHDCAAESSDDCACVVSVTQRFTVEKDEDDNEFCDYDASEPLAEVGRYDRISCGVCGGVLWQVNGVVAPDDCTVVEE